MRQEVELFKNLLTECVTMSLMKSFAFRFGVIFTGLFVFAACTVQTTPSLLSSSADSVDTSKKFLNDVPFAFDLVFDTISYNSCVGAGLNSNGNLHGLKIGANEGFVETNDSGAVRAGLKLRSDFLQYIAKSVNPAFPNTAVVPAQVQYILENSTRNEGVQIQYAVREKSNLRVVQDVIDQSKTNGLYTLSRDGIYEAPQLTQEPVVSSIVKNVVFGPNKTVSAEGPRIYNLGTAAAPDAIEASFGFSAAFDETYPATADQDDGVGAGEEYSDKVREKFNSGQQVLAVTYGNTATISSSDTSESYGLNSPRRAVETVLSRAYGRSYELNFKAKASGISSQRRNILNSVTEKNLETGSLASASWSCEHYVIMKSNEWNNKKSTEPACSEIMASDLADATYGPALKVKIGKIRRHYSESNWGIGFMIKANTAYVPATRFNQPICLVNKAVNCYLPTNGIVTTDAALDIGVNYAAAEEGNTQECYLSRYRQMQVTYNGNKSGDVARMLGRCPQYASICVRSSTSY